MIPTQNHMINALNKNQLVSILQSLSISPRENNDGNIVVTLPSTGEFPYDIQVVFIITGGGDGVDIISLCPGLQIQANEKAKALFLCNRWNNETRWPKTTLFEDSVRAYHHVSFGDGPVSLSYFRSGCIEKQLLYTCKFFFSLLQ